MQLLCHPHLTDDENRALGGWSPWDHTTHKIRRVLTKDWALNWWAGMPPGSLPSGTLPGLKLPHSTYLSSSIFLVLGCFDSCFHFPFIPHIKIYFLLGLALVQAAYLETSIFNFIKNSWVWVMGAWAKIRCLSWSRQKLLEPKGEFHPNSLQGTKYQSQKKPD